MNYSPIRYPFAVNNYLQLVSEHGHNVETMCCEHLLRSTESSNRLLIVYWYELGQESMNSSHNVNEQ